MIRRICQLAIVATATAAAWKGLDQPALLAGGFALIAVAALLAGRAHRAAAAGGTA